MKIGQIKLLCYVAALVLVGLGGKDVYEYIQAKEVELHAEVEGPIRLALERVERKEPERTGIVSYEDVKRGYHRFNWTGEAPPVIEAPDPDTPVEEPKIPVSDLIIVLMLRIDTTYPDRSTAAITFTNSSGMTGEEILEGQDLRKGDTLLGKLSWAKVANITVEGIEFEFEEEGRENETVRPDNEVESEIYMTDAEGVIRPSTQNRLIPSRPGLAQRFKEKTYERRPGEFRIGTEDQKDIAANYPTILSNEIRHRRHRDPKTGRFDGIEIQSVTPGSFASRHGAQAGDIVRSINGHPVSSVAEIVSFVREHENEYTTWEVEIENQGKIRTVTYESPPEN